MNLMLTQNAKGWEGVEKISLILGHSVNFLLVYRLYQLISFRYLTVVFTKDFNFNSFELIIRRIYFLRNVELPIWSSPFYRSWHKCERVPCSLQSSTGERLRRLRWSFCKEADNWWDQHSWGCDVSFCLVLWRQRSLNCNISRNKSST